MTDVENTSIGARLRAARKAAGLTVADLAEQWHDLAPGNVRRRLPALRDLERTIRSHEAGEHTPSPRYRLLWAHATGRTEADLFGRPSDLSVPAALDDELATLELARRVAASDVGDETLVALEMTVDELASAYPRSAPGELLARTRRHLGFVSRLMDARMTLAERRRLVTVGGWLSLLAATCDIDLGREAAAAARLRTAAQLAEHAEHPEIHAWTVETRAWQKLTDGNFQEAVTLAREAQDVAPRGGSAFIQATAQEGRAWARLGDGAHTRDALTRVERLVEPLPMPDRPEHHYRYDPAKSDAYTATTLAWAGDSAAEPYARGVLARIETPSVGPARPRRAASARLDLALALLAAGRPDEAAQTALEAVTSGRLVPSNYWRAAEVIRAVKARSVPEAPELYEAYRELCASTEDPFADG